MKIGNFEMKTNFLKGNCKPYQQILKKALVKCCCKNKKIDWKQNVKTMKQ